MDIKHTISKELDIPASMIEDALSLSRAQVKKFSIDKRNGGKRSIYQPSKKLKTLQYWLIHNIFKKLPIHDSAMAYREEISTLNNAEFHRENKYFLKIDFTDFFPSIMWNDLKPIIEIWHKEADVAWDFDKEAHDLIRNACFYKGEILPIGYPSSPIISNAVMFDFDNQISKIIGDNERFGETVYSRYADDIVLSTNKKNVCLTLLKEIASLVKKTKSPKLSINHKKTKLSSSTGGSAIITGLRVIHDGHITIHKKQKDHIRLLLSLYKKGKLSDKEKRSLVGHLSYAKHTAPQFYSKVQSKYFLEISALKDEFK